MKNIPRSSETGSTDVHEGSADRGKAKLGLEWFAIRSDPTEGVNGWWIRSRDGLSIGWVDGGSWNEPVANLVAASSSLLWALERFAEEASNALEIPGYVRDALKKARGQS